VKLHGLCLYWLSSYVDTVIQSYGNIVIISIKFTYNSGKNELEINSKSVMVMENHKLMSYMQKSVLLMNYELFGFFKISFLKSGIELLMHFYFDWRQLEIVLLGCVCGRPLSWWAILRGGLLLMVCLF
jgi:hypothetical protein